MSKNIVILSGSPRKNGNSEKLVTAFKDGAESTGKTVTVFRASHMKVGGCVGCEFCIENKGKCSLKDGMAQILDVLHNADAVVLASPVYYFSFTAQLKTMIDRMYPLISNSRKRAALLLTCADESSDTATGAIAIYDRMVKYYEWDNAGIVIATGVEHLGDIGGKCELEDVKKLGCEI